MADIVPIAGKVGTLTVNGVTVRLTRVTPRIQTGVIEFGTTSQTADADSNYWLNVLANMNSWSVQADGYVDHNAVAAARLIGDNIKFRPGTTAAGTVSILLSANHGFSGSCLVENIETSFDAEDQSKPMRFSCTLRGDGAVTYTNS